MLRGGSKTLYMVSYCSKKHNKNGIFINLRANCWAKIQCQNMDKTIKTKIDTFTESDSGPKWKPNQLEVSREVKMNKKPKGTKVCHEIVVIRTRRWRKSIGFSPVPFIVIVRSSHKPVLQTGWKSPQLATTINAHGRHSTIGKLPVLKEVFENRRNFSTIKKYFPPSDP